MTSANASAPRTSSTTTGSNAGPPIDSVPGKPACSPLEPYGRAGATTTSWRRARAPLRRRAATTVSVTNVRCGPCCSVEPSGIASKVRGRAAQDSAEPSLTGESRWRGSIRDAESAREAIGNHDVGGAQLADRRTPETEQRGVDPAAEDVEHVLHAGLSVGREPPQVGAPDHHGARAEGDRFDDVAAPPDAAVEHDLDRSPTASTTAGRLGSTPASRRGCCRRGSTPRSRSLRCRPLAWRRRPASRLSA